MVKLIVFDWAGTLIDCGSRAPVLAAVRSSTGEGGDEPASFATAAARRAMGERDATRRFSANTRPTLREGNPKKKSPQPDATREKERKAHSWSTCVHKQTVMKFAQKRETTGAETNVRDFHHPVSSLGFWRPVDYS